MDPAVANRHDDAHHRGVDVATGIRMPHGLVLYPLVVWRLRVPRWRSVPYAVARVREGVSRGKGNARRPCAVHRGRIGGVGIFLGPNDASVDALVRHVDYAVDLVGPDHVGLSTDYPFDHEDFNTMMRDDPELFPDCYTRWGPIDFMPLEGLLTVEGALRNRGYPDDAVTAILGGNFRRVATQVWK
jgi:microsomal dipeptidase-like Zn-dependent dipeptidase